MDYKEQIQKLVGEIKAQGYENICFMQPALNIGGGPLIEANLAKYLVNNTELNLYFCDYNQGYGEFLLKDCPKVKKLIYKDDDIIFPLKEKCILVTDSTRVVLIKNMHPESKFLFWHYQTNPCGWEYVLINNESKKYLELTKKENAMVYHDWSGRNSLSRFTKINFTNKDYIHIVLDKKDKECSFKFINNEEINICFLSRLAIDKMQALFNLVKNFATYKTDKKKRLHVIGDGKTRNQVEEYCKKYENEIEFIFTGSIARENLDNYLVNNIDILFGVGTCVVEGAALKLPSVVLILDTKEFNDTDAFWLYDSKEYTVGILKEQKSDLKIKYTKIHEILDDVYKRDNKEKNGKECYEYYINNHENYDELVCNFLNSLKNTSLTYKKIKKCIKYIPYSKYSHEILKFKKVTIVKKVNFLNKTKYLLFGFIEIFKEKRLKKETKYYILGIPCKKIFKKVYDFPAARFDNRKDYMGVENVK